MLKKRRKVMAMRRLPGASRTLGAVGSWNPLVSFSFSPWSRVSAPLLGRPSAFHLTSAFHASRSQALLARYLPWARASSFTTCTLVSVPVISTPAPCTAPAWMKRDFACWGFPRIRCPYQQTTCRRPPSRSSTDS